MKAQFDTNTRVSDRTFDEQRAETVRTRSSWIWPAAAVVWIASFVWVDHAVFTRAQALAVRGPEVFLAIAISVWLRRPRSLVHLEVVTVAAWGIIAALSAHGLEVVPADKLPAKVASLVLSVLVVCPLGAFTWRATAGAGVVTVLALSGLPARGAGSLYNLTITVVGFAYVVLVVAAVARDRLKRSEFDARVALRTANERLRREDDVRRRLFVNLSHDLRTPLAVVRGEADLLLRSGRIGTPDDAASLRRIEGNARALADLADQLLDLARLEAGEMPLRVRKCDVVRIARDVAALLESPGRPHVDTRSCETSVVVLADPVHVERIIVNLVANARRHATNDVTLDISAMDRRVIVDVIDDGQGVVAERREAIFERFVSFDSDGSTAAGIGLPLARELATLNGGSLVLLDGSPRTTFRLELRAADGPVDEESAPPRRPRDTETDHDGEAPGAASLAAHTIETDASLAAKTAEPDANVASPTPFVTSPRRRLLVVEDNPDMATLLRRVLEPSFVVDHVATRADAVARLGTEVPDAVLSDVLLPDGTGYDVLSTIRARRGLEHVPVVLVSALGEAEERVRGLSAGADDYLAKPFSTRELERRLWTVIERAETRKHALEAQRDAMLMEIHDGVSASLARASILLGGPTTEASAAHARDAIRDGLEEVRAITKLLAQEGGDWSAFTASVRRAMADACAASSIRLVFESEGPASVSVPAPVAHTLRRVAREATTNAIKHSGARTLTCRLAATPSAWFLRVEDDGSGFSASRELGQGIGIMRRRVARLGGEMEIGNRPEGGVFVVAMIERIG